jgi:hypothetical protein
MSDSSSLLWVIVASARVSCALQQHRSSDIIELIAIVGGSNNGPLMS